MFSTLCKFSLFFLEYCPHLILDCNTFFCKRYYFCQVLTLYCACFSWTEKAFLSFPVAYRKSESWPIAVVILTAASLLSRCQIHLQCRHWLIKLCVSSCSIPGKEFYSLRLNIYSFHYLKTTLEHYLEQEFCIN